LFFFFIFKDQPLVGQQLADLGLGIRINPFELTAVNARKAINEILSDDRVIKKVIDISKKSRQYNGIKNGAGLIVEFMQKNIK
jgi:UDP:flavonoid glycosyltransferase YjiC (YdhE family)